jgi:hypothetical protein
MDISPNPRVSYHRFKVINKCEDTLMSKRMSTDSSLDNILVDCLFVANDTL